MRSLIDFMPGTLLYSRSKVKSKRHEIHQFDNVLPTPRHDRGGPFTPASISRPWAYHGRAPECPWRAAPMLGLCPAPFPSPSPRQMQVVFQAMRLAGLVLQRGGCAPSGWPHRKASFSARKPVAKEGRCRPDDRSISSANGSSSLGVARSGGGTPSVTYSNM